MKTLKTVASDNTLPPIDSVIEDIANYAITPHQFKPETLETARYALMDSIGCGILALDHPACRSVLGPLVPGTTVENGVCVPGTSYVLDPVQSAFNMTSMIRWLDYNDTWLAAEWAHPSDNFGAILSAAAYAGHPSKRTHALTMRHVLESAVKAYEIQGVLCLDNSLNQQGLDHVTFVRVASAAVAAHLLGGTRKEVESSIAHAWIDGGPLRTYRHSPNTGARKSWAAGDAASRAVRLALLVLLGQTGYPSTLTAKNWGFQDAVFGGEQISLQRSLSSYVMDNILFKLPYPTEFHAQTALEAAIKLYPDVVDRWDSIYRIEIETNEPAIRIISKTGPLHNYADRDHCLQYIVAVGLLEGKLESDHYGDTYAQNPLIERLRERMTVKENSEYTAEYYDPEVRSVGSSIRIVFEDGSTTDRIEIRIPVGHPRRRPEGLSLLEKKFAENINRNYSQEKVHSITRMFLDHDQFLEMNVSTFLDRLSGEGARI